MAPKEGFPAKSWTRPAPAPLKPMSHHDLSITGWDACLMEQPRTRSHGMS